MSRRSPVFLEIAGNGHWCTAVHTRRSGLKRLRLRGPCGVQDEFTLTATAQYLWKLSP
ncbi:hypothetical protein GN278_02775 [Rhodobacteraceae bacterium Araon29]